MALFRKPLELADRFSADGARYLLLREMQFGQDSEFSPEGLVRRYNADLAHDLGNLANRVINMTNRYLGGIVADPPGENDVDRDLRDAAIATPDAVRAAVDAMQPHQAIHEAIALVKRTNGYLEQKAPWSAARAGDMESVATTLYYACEALGIAATLLSPAMPTKMAALRAALSLPAQPRIGGWGHLEPGATLGALPILFPKIEE
jgi:methionyl-tRNA synthetase